MFSSILQRIMAPTVFDLISLSAVSLLITLAIFKGSKINTPLRGPRSPSFIFGHYRYIQEQNDPELVYEKWAKKYGPAYQVTGPFGSKRIVICDPKANAHFYSRETNGYVQTKLAHVFIENLVSFDLQLRSSIAQVREQWSASVLTVWSGSTLGRGG